MLQIVLVNATTPYVTVGPIGDEQESKESLIDLESRFLMLVKKKNGTHCMYTGDSALNKIIGNILISCLVIMIYSMLKCLRLI